MILDTIAALFLFLCRLESSSSDSSEEYVPEGDADEDEDGDEDVSPEAEEPLVRCKRPMCEMYCEFGFQTDSTGCPTCECLCLLYTSPSPRDRQKSRMPSSA